MRQILAQVVENRQLWQGVHLLTFDTPDLNMGPGQCALVRDPLSLDPYLRRTCWLYQNGSGRTALLVLSAGNEAFLARAQVHSFLDLLVPVGHAVEPSGATRRVLLLGENDRALPLPAIAAAAVQRGCEVVLSVQGQAPEQLPPHFLLPPEVEYHSGVDAVRGELLGWADQTVACGSDAFYRRIADRARESNFRLEPGRVRVLLDPAMPCGTGACCACGVAVRHRLRLACVDGPWFDLTDL